MTMCGSLKLSCRDLGKLSEVKPENENSYKCPLQKEF